MNSSIDLKSGQRKLSMQMLILVAVIILIAAIGLLTVKYSSGSPSGGDSRTGQLSAKLLKDVTLTQTNLYKIQNMVASNQDKKEIEKFSEQQVTVINQSIGEVRKALEADASAEQKKFYQGIIDNLNEYQKSAVRFMKLAPAGTGAAYLSAANEKMEALSGLLIELSAAEVKPGEASGAPVTLFAALIALAALMVLSVFIIPALVKSMMNHHVVEPISETSRALKEYSGGKFSRQLAWEGDDAIGELVQTVNALKTKMNASGPAAPASIAATAEPARAAKAAAQAEDISPSLSGMVKKTPDQDSLVLTSKKAIDKLQDI